MFLIALKTLKLVSQTNDERRTLAPPPETAIAAGDTRSAEAMGPGGIISTGNATILNESSRERAARVAQDRPEAAARQLRTWMQES